MEASLPTAFAAFAPVLASTSSFFVNGSSPRRPLYRVRRRPRGATGPPRPRHASSTIVMAAAPGAERALWAENLSMTYDGDNYQFKDIDLIIPVGAKLALLGGNGVGKSSLLKILSSQLLPEAGTCQRRKGLSIAFVSQDLPTSLDANETVLRAVFRLAGATTSSSAVRAALSYAKAVWNVEEAGENVSDDMLEALTKASSAMERETDAWGVEAYMQTALTKLALPLEKSVDSLSGGQQRRLSLAAALVAKPDILLCDEPTNHLSVESIEYLEEVLGEPGLTVLCISHDRAFVDNFAQDIWELDGGGLHKYGPGYGNFLQAKSERLIADRKEQANVARMYKKELVWYRKQPKARGTKAKARVEKFEKLEQAVKRSVESSEVQGLSTATTRLGGKVLDVKNMTLRRGGRLILDDFSYSFDRGERVGIIGKNGVGKSSFVKAILSKIPLESGSVEVGDTVKFGYFDQDGLDLPGDMRVIEYMNQASSLAGGVASGPSGPGRGNRSSTGDFEDVLDARLDKLSFSAPLPSQQAENINPLAKMAPITLLQQFGFAKDRQHSLISTLSGGEKRRLQILSLLISNPNVMLCDELTNDLDVTTLSMLEELLDDFTGTLILVSHDRMLLDRLVNHLIVVEGDGSVSFFEGKFTDFLAEQKEKELEKRRQSQMSKKSGGGNSVHNDVLVEKPVAKKAKLSYKERKQYEGLENEIAEAEARQEELNRLLVDEAQSAEYDHLSKWTDELAQLETEIASKSELWLDLAERAEILG